MQMLSHQYLEMGWGVCMVSVVSFLLSVVACMNAYIFACYICKWLTLNVILRAVSILVTVLPL